jgi:hypothetical protein
MNPFYTETLKLAIMWCHMATMALRGLKCYVLYEDKNYVISPEAADRVECVVLEMHRSGHSFPNIQENNERHDFSTCY